MDQNVPKLYKEYGQYVNESRAFPLSIDGLKPAERRVLLSAYLIAKNKLVKSVKVDGHTVGNLHPHGNVYGTIVQLVRQGFLTGQGNFGSTCGADSNPPAASRYTEVMLEPKMIQLAFKYISYVEWKMNDLGEKEPTYLPTMFPMTLMGTDYTQGIGFGFRTFIPCYKITDLQKRLLWLLGESKVEPIIKPISDCKITSNDEVLKELLTTGKAKIDVEGITKISNRKSSITLKSWPPGKRFVSLLTKFSKEFDNQDIGFTDLSSTETNIVFQVLRQRNKDLIFKNFVKKLKKSIKGAISFETIVVEPDKEIKLKSIDDMLLDTFDMYLNVNKTMLEYEISKIQTIIDEIKILIKIKPYLSKVLLLKDDIKKAISIISEKSKVDEKIISKLFSKYNISKLLTVNTDTTKLLNEISVYKNNLSNLKTFVINQYKGE
jgi:DNA gyrase/topoisomerase IV subunit A